MGKKTYCYIAGVYNIDVDGVGSRSFMGLTYRSDMGINPSGIPTMGTMEGICRHTAESNGGKYVEGTLVLLNLARLSKSQYERLRDRKDNSKEEFFNNKD